MIYFRITQFQPDDQPDEKEIRRRHRVMHRKRVERISLALWFVFLGFCWGLTPYCFQYADAHRAVSGIGGEILIPLLPFLLIPAFDGISNLIIRMKGWDR